jgi:Domain of unknown function (DUF6471)
MSDVAPPTEICYFRQVSIGNRQMAGSDKEKEWGDRARRYLKAELRRANVGYRELAERLTKHGIPETEVTVTGKLARGAFSAAFFFACLAALELTGIDLSDL